MKIKPLYKPNLKDLEDNVNFYIQECQRKDITSDELSDIEHYIFEEAINAFYGEDVWLVLNELSENL